jgi:GDSL-like Lipase/Acylhydrolase family
MRPRESMKALGAKALLLVVSSLCALAIAEMILRVAYPQQLGVWYTLRSGMVIHPPQTRIYLANFGQTVEFNSQGMRDVEHRQTKEPGTFRILLLGDSFMEALQVPLEESFPRLLEHRLRTLTGRPVEVVSAAVSGWATDQHLAYVRQYGVTLTPDLILVAMTLHNDIAENLQEHFHTIDRGRVVARPPVELSNTEFRTLKVKQYLASRSHFYQLLRRARELRHIRKAKRHLDAHVMQLIQEDGSAAIAKGWELTGGLLVGIRDEGARLGARASVVLIPLSLQIYPDVLRGWLAANGVPADRLALEGPQARMREIAAAAEVTTIDLLPAFRRSFGQNGRGLHLERDGHWNQQGHRIAAALVADELIGRGLVTTRASAGR